MIFAAEISPPRRLRQALIDAADFASGSRYAAIRQLPPFSPPPA